MAFLFWSDDVRCLSVLFYAGFLLKEVLRGVVFGLGRGQNPWQSIKRQFAAQ